MAEQLDELRRQGTRSSVRQRTDHCKFQPKYVKVPTALSLKRVDALTSESTLRNSMLKTANA
jgi:hypothetical protein